MITYNLSKYYDLNNKFTIVVKKDKKIPPNMLVQPPMIFTRGHMESRYEHTTEIIKKLRPYHKAKSNNINLD